GTARSSRLERNRENPNLIQDELNRRLDAAQKSSPTKRRQESLQRDLTRVRKSIERLMTAYQEELLSLDELRSRMPDLRQRERAMKAELQSIATQAQDRAAYLRLVETLSAFLSRVHALLIRHVDDANLSAHPVRAICGRCDLSLQER